MRLLSITLNNVRRFADPVQVDGIADGLNILCEPNEAGKSTIFDAVQALFFVPHRSQAKEVKALRPHAGGAPEVAVEIETEEGQFRLSKRWLSRPEARVTRDERLVAQADEAEAWIARLTVGSEGGPSGLLWVRQGMTALDHGTAREQEAGLEARRSLLSSVTGEVEAMTGGRRMDAALARCREELERYATSTGRPRTGGPWKEAAEAVDGLRLERDRLHGIAGELAAALERRRAVRRELVELEAPKEVEARRARLAEARQAFAAAERHADVVARAADALRMAELEVSRREDELARLRAARQERTQAAEALERARSEREVAEAALRDAEARQAVSASSAKTAAQALAAAQEGFRAAHRRQAAREGARRRQELTSQMSRAEAARAELEAATAAAQVGPDAETLCELERLGRELRDTERLRDRTSASLVMSYAPGAEGHVRLGSAPLAHEVRTTIAEGAILEIPEVGRLTIHPGDVAAAGAVEAASVRLAEALTASGLDDLAEARRRAAARDAAARSARETRAKLNGIAPEGIEALRAELAAIPEAAPCEEDGPSAEEAQDAVAAAEAAAAAAVRAGEADWRTLETVRDRAVRAEVAEAAAAERLERSDAALGDSDPAAWEGDLEVELAECRAARDTAQAQHRELAEAAPDLEAARAALGRAEAVVEQADQRARELTSERDRLDERIDVRSGEAVEEEFADVQERLQAAEAQLGRIEFEVRVLTRLRAALEAARAEARERYFEPVMRELAPLLRLLWPEAELEFDEQTLLPVALTRAGQAEEIDVLSGGTREQVALLVRLAFARMLSASGRHAPVILDDALVYTDDDRIERMFDALHRQAADLQIIVLSCRQRAFRDLGGRVLRLERVEEVVA